ncbi:MULTISPECIES: DUF4870 domain-containing protein [Chitinophagaceae]
MESNNFTPLEQKISVANPNMEGKPTNDECNLAMLAHILALFSYFLGPLIIYLVKKDESPFVANNAKNALNFQISLFLYSIAGAVLCIIIIGIFVLIALGILHLVFCIMAAVAARDGKVYKYPLAIQFLK